MAKQVMDIQASVGISSDQSNEHQRRWSETAWADAAFRGNYDPTRARINFEINSRGEVQEIDTTETIPARIKRVLHQRNIVDPNVRLRKKGKHANRRTVVNIIFGGSRERMHQIAFGTQKVNLSHGADNSNIERNPDIERWAKDIYDFACDKWGKENIVGFYCHLDELNPHIHCTVLPISRDNKFSYKAVFAGENKYEFQNRTLKLHDDLAVVNAKWGLERGDNILLTGAKHRSTEEYREALRLQCNELESKMEEKLSSLDNIHTAVEEAIARKETLNNSIAELSQKEDLLVGLLVELGQRLKTGEGDEKELNERITNLRTDLSQTSASLTEMKLQLRIANREFENLQKEMLSVKEHTEIFKREQEKASADTQTQIRLRLTDSIYAKAMLELRRLYSLFTPEERQKYCNDFLIQVSEKPGETVKCAMYLYAGMVDGASRYAKSIGGEGMIDDLANWSRMPDEDDRRFSLRCMEGAKQMLGSDLSHQMKKF